MQELTALLALYSDLYLEIQIKKSLAWTSLYFVVFSLEHKNMLGKLLSFRFSKQLERNKYRGSSLFGIEDKFVLHFVLSAGCQTSCHILALCLRIWTPGLKCSQTFLWGLQGKGVITSQSSTSDSIPPSCFPIGSYLSHFFCLCSVCLTSISTKHKTIAYKKFSSILYLNPQFFFVSLPSMGHLFWENMSAADLTSLHAA